MNYSINNDIMKVKVDSLGSELSSIKTMDGHEYLWQGSSDSWMGRSPILFPIIGGLPDDSYFLDGKTYSMASHGFARKKDWSLQQSTGSSLTFSLETDSETRKQYPFDFTFAMSYTLAGSTLEVKYDIGNAGDAEMPFSVGGHPGFQCPLETGYSFDDYRLRFEKPETTVRYLKEGKLLTSETEPFRVPAGILHLNHSLFERGAIILREFESNSIVLGREGGGRSVRVDFKGFPDLGLWTYPDKPAPYICIEPWFGVDSTAGDSGEIRTKSGIISLKPGGRFEARFSITIG
jgi:galactose mutarotase-like enzyme